MKKAEERMLHRVEEDINDVHNILMTRMREIIFTHDLNGIQKVTLMFKMFNAISTVVVEGRKQMKKLFEEFKNAN
jgi:hypothetical protein